MIAIESFAALFFLRRAAPWSDLLRVAAVAFGLYAHWFYWHFQLGQKTGACALSWLLLGTMHQPRHS
jgi:hypothetical protein